MAALPARPLTVRQRRFVEEYRLCGVAALAARRAGYSPHSAKWIGRDLLLSERVGRALRAAAAPDDGGDPDQGRLRQELARMAFANLLDYARVDADGDLDLDLRRMDRAKAAAIKELIIDQTTDPRTGVVRKRVRFKLADKQAALTRMMAQAPISPQERDQWMAIGRAELFELDEAGFRRRQEAWKRGERD